jgi:hypothetical protein
MGQQLEDERPCPRVADRPLVDRRDPGDVTDSVSSRGNASAFPEVRFYDFPSSGVVSHGPGSALAPRFARVHHLVVPKMGPAVDSASPPVPSDPNAGALRNPHVGFEREDYTDRLGRQLPYLATVAEGCQEQLWDLSSDAQHWYGTGSQTPRPGTRPCRAGRYRPGRGAVSVRYQYR